MISPKARLVVALVLFLGWMVWLGYTALAKNRGPIMSHAQAAATAFPVVADLTTGSDGKPVTVVKVVESLKPGGPAAGTELLVVNLTETQGFDGPGQYLLLLVPDVAAQQIHGMDRPTFAVVGPQRSPGYDLAGTGKPTVYPWTREVKAQAEKLFK